MQMAARTRKVPSDPLERVVGPVVRGQVKCFIQSHPSILEGVDWEHGGLTKEEVLINSISKRVIRDLVCPETRKRIAEAMATPTVAIADDAPACKIG